MNAEGRNGRKRKEKIGEENRRKLKGWRKEKGEGRERQGGGEGEEED